MHSLAQFTRSILFLTALAGSASPEDARPRGGGPGADGGNYQSGSIHAPSKLDGTRSVLGALPQ
jgi:hypothetical protein